MFSVAVPVRPFPFAWPLDPLPLVCGETNDLIAPATAAGVVSDLPAPFLGPLLGSDLGRFHSRLALGRVGFAVAGNELDPQPAEDVIDDALGVRDFRVGGPARRLEARVGELVDKDPSGTPYCRPSDVRVPMVSISPPIVLPSLAMVMNSSPG